MGAEYQHFKFWKALAKTLCRYLVIACFPHTIIFTNKKAACKTGGSKYIFKLHLGGRGAYCVEILVNFDPKLI
jgi:hypothetical protein